MFVASRSLHLHIRPYALQSQHFTCTIHVRNLIHVHFAKYLARSGTAKALPMFVSCLDFELLSFFLVFVLCLDFERLSFLRHVHICTVSSQVDKYHNLMLNFSIFLPFKVVPFGLGAKGVQIFHCMCESFVAKPL
jgi:hypothetical protein